MFISQMLPSDIVSTTNATYVILKLKPGLLSGTLMILTINYLDCSMGRIVGNMAYFRYQSSSVI
jgi:hypothetical protein